MAKEKQIPVNNPKLRDSSSKLIFGDNILCSQFLRDYADMEILRNIRPEDIEDVSERYVPLYSTERDSDTVKKVNIARYVHTEGGGNLPELPLYIVSLVEHKTKVEYNVAMQVLRYVIHIWEDYEKEMEKKYPHISARKDFRYPPILPIVYYEGRGKWTAPVDLADRILCKELMGDYLPHFKYQLVGLHEYTNEELLARGDEISLAMLINKIRCVEDMEAFICLPDEKVEGILKDTPEYLLDIMESLLRALLYSMNLEEEETETAVSKIKEKKMGRLFEDVTFDFQAEKKKAREEARREGLEEGRKAGIEAGREEGRKEGRRAGMEEGRKAGIETGIELTRKIARLSKQYSDDEIVEEIMREFGLTKEEVENAVRLVLGEETVG